MLWNSQPSAENPSDRLAHWKTQAAIEGSLLYIGAPLGLQGGKVLVYDITRAGLPSLVHTIFPPQQQLKV